MPRGRPASRAAHFSLRRLPGALLLLLAALPLGAEQITILHTTDLHGHVYQHRDKSGAYVGGLDRIATLIQRERRKDPDLLLVDCGDTIQGNSQAFLFKGRHIIDCMNYLGYDAMAIGNHEFNFGQAVLAERKWDARFPWLSANTLMLQPPDSWFTPAEPYIIKTVHGVRVGIIGLVVTDIPIWEQPDYIERLKFADIVETARTWVARARPLCDVLVVVAHTGVGPTSSRAKGSDPGAAGAAIARACPEIDVLICGHRHVPVESKTVNGVLLTEADHWGSCLGKITLDVEAGHVSAKKAALIPADPSTPPDPGLLAVMAPYDERWKKWAEERVAVLKAPLDFREAQKQETAAVDLIHDAMKEATGTDVTFHVAFNNTSVFPAGPLTNEDVFNIYEYDNALWVLTLTGRQIKEALEIGARGYGTWRFLTAGGLTYALDPSRPAGERVLWVKYQGQPLADARTLRVAVNHYNSMGGGGMTPLRQAEKVEKTGKWVRETIADYLRKHSPYTPQIHHWWSVAARSSRTQKSGKLTRYTPTAEPSSP